MCFILIIAITAPNLSHTGPKSFQLMHKVTGLTSDVIRKHRGRSNHSNPTIRPFKGCFIETATFSTHARSMLQEFPEELKECTHVTNVVDGTLFLAKEPQAVQSRILDESTHQHKCFSKLRSLKSSIIIPPIVISTRFASRQTIEVVNKTTPLKHESPCNTSRRHKFV